MIILIGLPCSGKTFYSKYIGNKFRIPYFDTDYIFYDRLQIRPLDFIKKFGTKMFRRYEFKILKEYVEKYKNQNIILSTGGGVLEYKKSFNLLINLQLNNKNNFVIYLSINYCEFKKRYNKRINKIFYTDRQLMTKYSERIKKYNYIYNMKLDTNDIYNKIKINHNIFEILSILIVE